MYLSQFYGSENAKGTIAKALNDGTLSHALLIAGEGGMGVNCFARLLAADIVGAKNIAEIENETNPLVTVIRGAGASGQIKVDDIRRLNEDAGYSSVAGERRVFIIRNCENFNASSANALLKNLEEPKDDITYILTTDSLRRILATIRSRCRVYTLSLPSEAQAREYFAKSGADVRKAARYMKYYGANIGKIQRTLNDEKRAALLDTAVKITESAAAKDAYTVSKLLYPYVKDRASVRAILGDLRDIASQEMSESSVRMLDTVLKYTNILKTNVGLNIAIENFAAECSK